MKIWAKTEDVFSPGTGQLVVVVTATDSHRCPCCGRLIGNHNLAMDGTELRAPIEPATHDKFAPRAHYAIPPKATN